MTFQQHKNQGQPANFPLGEGRKRTSNFLILTLFPPLCVRAREGAAFFFHFYQSFLLSLKFTLTILGSLIILGSVI